MPDRARRAWLWHSEREFSYRPRSRPHQDRRRLARADGAIWGRCASLRWFQPGKPCRKEATREHGDPQEQIGDDRL